MTGCIYKLPDGRCDKPGRYLSPCIGEACEHQTPSNGDRIRAMGDEELSVWISALYTKQYHVKGDPNFWLEWLKSPAEPGEAQE